MNVSTKPRRRFRVAMLVALLLHFPLFPSNVGAWFRFLLDPHDPDVAEVDGEAIIPIDFDFDLDAPIGAASKATPEPPGGEEGLGASPDGGVPPSPARDAGAEVAADAGQGGGRPDAGAAKRDAAPPEPDGGPADAGAERTSDAGPDLRDPLSIANVPKKLFKQPNVQVWVMSDRIRKHELGAQFGKLLTSIPEWKHFFAGTTVDPIQDLDQILIAGPQLRDSRKIVAMLYYNVSEQKMRAAVDGIVTRSDPPGEWLADTPVDAARATAHGGERIFALVPRKSLLVVLPPEAKDQLGGLKNAGRLGKPGVGILATTITPGNALRQVPIPIPKSLKWVGVSVTPTADGGAEVVIDAIDETAELATINAEALTQAVEDKRKVEVFGMSFEAFQAVRFVATGVRIRASTKVSNRQLRYLMAEIERRLLERQQRADNRANKPATEPPGAPVPAATQSPPTGRPGPSAPAPTQGASAGTGGVPAPATTQIPAAGAED